MGSEAVSEAKYSDYIYWLEKSSWTVEEAAFIFSGLEPDSFTHWAYDYPSYDEKQRRSRFVSMQRLIKTAKSKNELPKGKITPNDWIRWAGRKALRIPSSLHDAIKSCREKQQKKQEQSNDGEKKASKDVSLKTKERDSLLKLIIAMAIGGYAYDPKKLRNDAVAEIEEDLESLGIPLDQDTIRKWLKEAAQVHLAQANTDDN